MRLIVRQLLRAVLSVLERAGVHIRIDRLRGATAWTPQDGRFAYQKRYVDFDIAPRERVLDVGSGGYPFPHATVLVDAFPKTTTLRGEPLVTAGKPFVVATVEDLPFRDGSFDFVYCAHLLEEVEDPLKACKEIMRVGKRGFIECPTMAKDMLFAWARFIPQKWHVVAIGLNLCFFEYSERQLDGIGSSVWLDLIQSKWYHPLQDAFYENQDIFNMMFSWQSGFTVLVFTLDGSVRVLNTEAGGTPFPGDQFAGGLL